MPARRLTDWFVRALPVRVTLDDASTPADLARCIAEIAAHLDARPERLRVVFDVPDSFTLDLTEDGRLAVRADGRRSKFFDLRHRWIADHPVPLALAGRTLVIDPVDANRFRVTVRGRRKRVRAD